MEIIADREEGLHPAWVQALERRAHDRLRNVPRRDGDHRVGADGRPGVRRSRQLSADSLKSRTSLFI